MVHTSQAKHRGCLVHFQSKGPLTLAIHNSRLLSYNLLRKAGWGGESFSAPHPHAPPPRQRGESFSTPHPHPRKQPSPGQHWL